MGKPKYAPRFSKSGFCHSQLVQVCGLSLVRGQQLLTNRTQELDLPRTIELFKVLILTYPRYIDSMSRDAVVGVLKAMIQRDEERGKSSGELKAVKIGLCCLPYFVNMLIVP